MATLSNESAKLVAWARGVVNLLMLGVGQQLKILWAIVQLIAVDVVNLFSGSEFAPNHLLDNENVFPASSGFKRVDAPIAASGNAGLCSCGRLVHLESVPIWMRFPVSFSRLAHLLFLGFGFGHTGEVCAMFSALYPKLNQAIPYGVAMNSKLSRNGFKRAIGILFFKPFRGGQLFYGAHSNMSPLYTGRAA